MATMEKIFIAMETIIDRVISDREEYNDCIMTIKGAELRFMFPALYEELVTENGIKFYCLDSWTTTSKDVLVYADECINAKTIYTIWYETESEYRYWGIREVTE